jgi:hypothetical protein
MTEGETVIRIKMDTKQVLNEMKIVDRESFDEVIKRLILASSQNEGSLKDATEKLIRERFQMKKQGKVVSIKDILKKMNEDSVNHGNKI